MANFDCTKSDSYHRQQYDQGEDFCDYCGEELTDRNTNLKMKTCPECNSRTPKDREKCSGCGFVFNPEKRKTGEKTKRERRTRTKTIPEFD